MNVNQDEYEEIDEDGDNNIISNEDLFDDIVHKTLNQVLSLNNYEPLKKMLNQKIMNNLLQQSEQFYFEDFNKLYNLILDLIKIFDETFKEKNEIYINLLFFIFRTQHRNIYNEDPMSKNKLENDILLSSKNVVKKAKRKRKIQTRTDRMEKNGNEINNKILLFKNNNREENPNDVNNIYNQNKKQEYNLNKINSNELEEGNRDTERDNKSRRIIKKIKYNPFCTYFCFLCVRKKKNIPNTLVNEGMNIIVEQLDILNLFRKLLKDEKIQETFSKDEVILMSDNCKFNIQEIMKNINLP